MYGLQLAALEVGRQHLGFHLVHGAEVLLLLQVEDGVRTSQGIETAQGGGSVEVGHHLRGPYLVEERLRLLGDYEGVAHQAGPVDARRIHQHAYAVGSVLAVAIVPDHWIYVEAGDAVQLVEAHGVAGHLYVFAEDFNSADRHSKAHSGGVRRRQGGQRVGDVDGVCAGFGKGVEGRRGQGVGGLFLVRRRLRFCSITSGFLGVTSGLKASFIPLGSFSVFPERVALRRGRSRASAGRTAGATFATTAGLASQQRIGLRILLSRLLGRFFGGLLRLCAILRHRVAEYLVQPGLRGLGHIIRDVTLGHGVVHQPVSADVDGVNLGALGAILGRYLVFRAEGHRSLAAQGHLTYGILVEKLVRKGEGVAGGVLHLHMPLHQHVVGDAVEEEGVAPCLLILAHRMHIPLEEEGLLHALIPSAVGRKHVVILPEIYPLGEDGAADAGFVIDAAAADEDGIREHVHIVLELEIPQFGIVGAV